MELESILRVTPQESPTAIRPRLGFTRSDSSTVRFSPRPEALKPGVRRTASPAPPMSPSSFVTAPETPRPRAVRDPRIFGIRTRYKPFWLLGMGTVGNVLYGTGTLAIERSIFLRKPLAQPGMLMPQPPYAQPLFNSRAAGYAIGGVSTAAGVLLAGTSCALFFQDARALARKLQPENTSYKRPNAYFAAHVVGIALSVGSLFIREGLRDANLSQDYTWVASLPGLLGATLFSVTQAQSASTCEVLNKRMPLKYRSHIGFAARCGVSLYTVWAAMMSIPDFNQYARELMRLAAQSSITLAYALPLTTARLGRQMEVDFESHQPDPNWYALKVLGLYIFGRIVAGFGPDILQQGVFDDEKDTSGYVFGGATAMAVGSGACVAAFMLFRNDVKAYKPRQADVLTGLICFALLCILAYTGVAQYAQQSRRINLLGAALLPGIIGVSLRLAILPMLFSYAELYRGDAPLSYRYQWTEFFRASAGLCFGVWGTLSGIPTANTYAKEAVGVAAGCFATLGMAFPTTQSRRALPRYAWPLSPPATPIGFLMNGPESAPNSPQPEQLGLTAFPFPATSPLRVQQIAATEP